MSSGPAPVLLSFSTIGVSKEVPSSITSSGVLGVSANSTAVTIPRVSHRLTRLHHAHSVPEVGSAAYTSGWGGGVTGALTKLGVEERQTAPNHCLRSSLP